MRLIAVSLIAVALAAARISATVGFSNCSDSFISGFTPDAPSNSVQICRDGVIAIAYDKDMVNPAYSAYHVTSYEASHEDTGRLTFYEDPDLKSLGVTQAAVDAPVWGEAWNRGHLCPNKIMDYRKDAQHATFTMANVAPQAGYLNQHPWGYLEDHTREWIAANRDLHLVTGVAYKDRSSVKRSTDGIAYPDYYWKVLCDVNGGESVGFVADNVEKGTPAMMSVYDVQKTFGGSLFPYSTCNTHTVNQTHWWSQSQYARLLAEGFVDRAPNATAAAWARKELEREFAMRHV